jgi:hypothetical protein
MLAGASSTAAPRQKDVGNMPVEKEAPDWGSVSDRNEGLAHFFGYVVVAGLVAEVISGFVWYHGLETVVVIGATTLIAVGVWGEVFFANKARKAGDKQLAQYEARAAEANERAVQAQLELEHLRKKVGPRIIDAAIFLKALEGKGKPTNLPLEIWYLPSDPDSRQLARQIWALLYSEAKWHQVNSPMPIPLDKTLNGPFEGVTILERAYEESPGLWGSSTLARALMDAFTFSLGGVQRQLDNEMAEGAMRIVVGPREP